MKSSFLLNACAVASALAFQATGVLAQTTPASAPVRVSPEARRGVAPFAHIVVIYEENHSFDNLYGKWGAVNGQMVNGLSSADVAHTLQVRQDGTTAFQCLKQNDVNLTSPPLPSSCTDTTGTVFSSDFTNAPFQIDDVIAPTDKTCPAPGVFASNGVPKDSVGALPGGCTKDLVHRYYQEIYQIHDGKQDRYVTGSDAIGLSMGYYDTTKLPIYQYLHSEGAPNYVIADNLFQAAFGGSFLNHQWLVAAATPVFSGAPNDGSANDLHSVVDVNGMPTSYTFYTAASTVRDSRLTASCSPASGRGPTPDGVTCGDYAINTIQPTYQPFAPGTTVANQLPPLTNLNIGHLLNAQGIRWAWYSGGWSNANGDVGAPGWTNGSGPTCSDPNANSSATYPNCPDKLFQFHHQALNYFASFAPGTDNRRRHLRDEEEFMQRAAAGALLPVSFVKPIGEENEHPGYTGETAGSDHLVDLLKAIFDGPNGDDTLVIVTYDEFGGQWDHVSPPGTTGGASGPHDQWGPGTRIPALLVAKKFKNSGVDHQSHDTTSIIATIEHQYRLNPIGTRDAQVNDFSAAITAAIGKKPRP